MTLIAQVKADAKLIQQAFHRLEAAARQRDMMRQQLGASDDSGYAKRRAPPGPPLRGWDVHRTAPSVCCTRRASTRWRRPACSRPCPSRRSANAGDRYLPGRGRGPGKARSCRAWASGSSLDRWNSRPRAGRASSAEARRAASPGPPAPRRASQCARGAARPLHHECRIAPSGSPLSTLLVRHLTEWSDRTIQTFGSERRPRDGVG